MGQVLSYIICCICGKAEEEEWTNDEVQPLIWNSIGDAREIILGNEQSSNVNTDCAFHNNPPYFQANSTTCSHSIARPELRQFPTIPFINVHSNTGSSMGPLSDSSTDDHGHASIALDIDTNFHVVDRAFSSPHLYSNGEELKEEEEERFCREGVVTRNSDSGSSMESHSESSSDDDVHAFIAFGTNTNVHAVEDRRHVFQQSLSYSSRRGPKKAEEERVSVGLISTIAWMGYYGSCHKILLVGEGDFSFSTSLARAFGSATNIIATSLDSIDFLRKNYSRAISNINKLTRKGCTVRHNVDATEMAGYRSFKGMKFDRIIFNFPHAGFFSEARDSQIRRHQTLVTSFFKNAMKMIYEDGQIHVTHKSNHGFHREWNLELLASMVGLRLVEEVPFNFIKYPGYRTKYGFGGDKNFDSHPSKTYMFGLKKRSLYGN